VIVTVAQREVDPRIALRKAELALECRGKRPRDVAEAPRQLRTPEQPVFDVVETQPDPADGDLIAREELPLIEQPALKQVVVRLFLQQELGVRVVTVEPEGQFALAIGQRSVQLRPLECCEALPKRIGVALRFDRIEEIGREREGIELSRHSCGGSPTRPLKPCDGSMRQS